MSGWNAAAPPDLAPRTARERFRMVWRGAAAALVFAALMAVFLAVRLFETARAGRRGGGRQASMKVVQAWARISLRLLGLRVKVQGRPDLRPGLVVANHASWLDIIGLQATSRPFLVSKAEVNDWPVIGWIGRRIGTLYIERRAAAAKRQEEDLRVRLEQRHRMALFPEGTSTDGQRVLPFRSSIFAGMFAGGLPEDAIVQPVAIAYRAPEGLPAPFYGWWGEMDFSAHLAEVLARSVNGVVEIAYLPAIPLAGIADRKAMARRSGAAVSEAFARLAKGI